MFLGGFDPTDDRVVVPGANAIEITAAAPRRPRPYPRTRLLKMPNQGAGATPWCAATWAGEAKNRGAEC